MLARPKSNYRSQVFFDYFSKGALYPMLGVFFTKCHLSGFEIGLILSLFPFASFVFIFFQRFFDVNFRRSVVILTLSVFSIVPLTGLLGDFSTCSNSNLTLVVTASFLVFLFAFCLEGKQLLLDTNIEESIEYEWNSYISEMTKVYNWGYTAYIFAGLTISFFAYLVSQYSHTVAFYSDPAFFASVCAIISQGALVAHLLSTSLHSTKKNLTTRIYSGSCNLLSSGRLSVFLIFALGSGLIIPCFECFVPLFLRGMGVAIKHIALVAAVQGISNVIFFKCNDWFIQRLGLENYMACCSCISVIRLALIPSFQTIWGIMFLQSFHGVSFAAQLVSGMKFTSLYAPPGFATQAHMIHHLCFNVLGGMIGCILGGYLFGLSGINIFRIEAMLQLGLLLLFVMSETVWIHNPTITIPRLQTGSMPYTLTSNENFLASQSFDKQKNRKQNLKGLEPLQPNEQAQFYIQYDGDGYEERQSLLGNKEYQNFQSSEIVFANELEEPTENAEFEI